MVPFGVNLQGKTLPRKDFLASLLSCGVALVIGLCGTTLRAETIDPNNDGSQFAWGENIGWINFEPSRGPGVTVTDTAVTGFAWGENVGWINLSPTSGGVIHDGAGNLSGYAWGENIGWISFSCENRNTCDTVAYGVTIDLVTGEFSGYAWGENVGWISFSCENRNTCDSVAYGVATELQPLNVPPFVTLTGLNAANEGDTVEYSFEVTDPGDTFNVTAGFPTCGTGGSFVAGSLTTSSTAGSFQCEFPDGPASPTVEIQVTDSFGVDSNIASIAVTVSNVAPVITSVTGPDDPLPLGTQADITVDLTDVGLLDTHECTFSWDDDPTSPTVTTVPVPATESGTASCTGSLTYTAAGVYTVTATVTDKDGGTDTGLFEFVVIFDPDDGFVTGGGWIDSPAGAYPEDPTLTGKANFGFVSKYKKGQSTPSGETEFQFRAAAFNFHSTSYDWLVISGPKAQFKGLGTVNGEFGSDNTSGYHFMLTAEDGQQQGGVEDRFRIKIVDKATDTLVYDNVLGASDDPDAFDPQVLGGGSITIHTENKK